MPASQKTLGRIKKLLALAAPSSNTTEAERASAAIEAAKLIAENDLTVGETPPLPPKIQRTPPPPPRPRVDWSTWGYPFGQPFTQSYDAGGGYREIVLGTDTVCGVCGRTIRGGESAFFDPNQGTRCYNITCHENG